MPKIECLIGSIIGWYAWCDDGLSTARSPKYILPIALCISVTPVSLSGPITQSIHVIPQSLYTSNSWVLCQNAWHRQGDRVFVTTMLIAVGICHNCRWTLKIQSPFAHSHWKCASPDYIFPMYFFILMVLSAAIFTFTENPTLIGAQWHWEVDSGWWECNSKWLYKVTKLSQILPSGDLSSGSHQLHAFKSNIVSSINQDPWITWCCSIDCWRLSMLSSHSIICNFLFSVECRRCR